MIERVAHAAAHRPILAVLLSALVFAAAVGGFAFATTAEIQDLFTPADLPEKQALDVIGDTFTTGDTVFVMVVTERPRAAGFVRDLDALAVALAAAPVVLAVDGLPDFVRDRVGDVQDADDAAIDDAVAAFERERPDLAGRYLATDAAVLSVTVTRGAEAADTVALVDGAIATHGRGDVADAFGLGAAYASVAASEAGAGDVAVLMPLAMLLMIIVLTVLFRRFTDVGWPFITVLAAVGVSYGLLPWLRVPLSPLLFSVGPLLLGIGIDYMLHVVHAFRSLPEDAPVADRMRAAAHDIGRPVAYTAVTTLIGFGSFLASPVPQIQHWGLLIGIGAIVAFVAAFTLLPALYGLSAGRGGRMRPGVANIGASFSRALKHRTFVLAGLLTLTAVLAYSATNVIVDDTVSAALDPETQTAKNLEAFQSRFGGGSVAFVLVREDAVAARDGLTQLSQAIAALPDVSFVDSVPARASAGRGAVTDASYQAAAAASPDLAKDGLSLVRFGYPDEDRLSVVPAAQAAVAAASVDATLTGPGVIEAVTQPLILDSLIASTLTAFGLVAVALVVLFRSGLWASLAFVPLLVVLVWQFGVQGMLGVPLNPVTGVTTAMVIGVGVDFSIHITAKVRRAHRHGAHGEEAAQSALASTGPPVFAASITTTAAFLVLAASNNPQLQQFGVVAAIVVASAFIVSMLLIPMIMSWVPRRASAEHGDDD